MLPYPQIDPVLVKIGPFALHWYGMMYALAFLLGWPLLQRRVARWMPDLGEERLNDLLVWILLGVVLGGRLGYVLFYQGGYYLAHPMAMLRVWEGGMSFHGGMLGVLLAGYIYCHRQGVSFLALADIAIPVFPLGLFLGRIGNFINAELWGRVTDVPWAMVFPRAGELPRHPSQLYEAALEGVVLFVILNLLGRRAWKPGTLLGVFISGYGVIRFGLEYVREPDAHLGLLALGLSMGQWLSLPMVLVGVALILLPRRRHDPV